MYGDDDDDDRSAHDFIFITLFLSSLAQKKTLTYLVVTSGGLTAIISLIKKL